MKKYGVMDSSLRKKERKFILSCGLGLVEGGPGGVLINRDTGLQVSRIRAMDGEYVAVYLEERVYAECGSLKDCMRDILQKSETEIANLKQKIKNIKNLSQKIGSIDFGGDKH